MKERQPSSAQPEAMRFALGIEYDGSEFHGWQKQPDGLPTVQETLEEALSRIADEPVRLACGGRTDRRVHALGQVAHFDCHSERTPEAFLRGANGLLPNSIRIRWAHQVTADFHARHSARQRHYRYIICNDDNAPVLMRQGVSWWRESQNVEKIQEACQHWLGEHDFSSFRGSGCQSPTPVRRIESIAVHRCGRQITVDIVANAFLLHMVRNLVGALRHIGRGQKPPSWAHELLMAKDRKLAPPPAAPQGLYLVAISYESHHQIPQTKRMSRLFEPFSLT